MYSDETPQAVERAARAVERAWTRRARPPQSSTPVELGQGRRNPLRRSSSAKAAAILAGASRLEPSHGDNYLGEPFLKAIADARRGDPEANQYIKAVLGTSDATGQAIVPNNFVADLVGAIATRNIFRGLMSVNTDIRAPPAPGDAPQTLLPIRH